MIPEWALKYKEKGMALEKHTSKSYYLYKVHSKRVKDKSYPILVHDELIGIVTESGIEYSTRKVVDVMSITVIPVSSSPVINLLPLKSRKMFEFTYLLKIKNKWYFSKLNNLQVAALEEIDIDYRRGFNDGEELFWNIFKDNWWYRRQIYSQMEIQRIFICSHT